MSRAARPFPRRAESSPVPIPAHTAADRLRGRTRAASPGAAPRAQATAPRARSTRRARHRDTCPRPAAQGARRTSLPPRRNRQRLRAPRQIRRGESPAAPWACPGSRAIIAGAARKRRCAQARRRRPACAPASADTPQQPLRRGLEPAPRALLHASRALAEARPRDTLYPDTRRPRWPSLFACARVHSEPAPASPRTSPSPARNPE